MGILDKLKFWQSDKGTGAAKYILKKQTKGGGMKKVAELGEPVDIEELYEDLAAGVYALHKYQKGKSGFSVVWGPIQVIGEEEERSEPARREQPREQTPGSALSEYAKWAKGFAELKEEAREEFEMIAPLLGFSGGGGDSYTKGDIMDALEEAEDDYERLNKIFGERTTGGGDITYEGTVPVWLHPKLIPELVDGTLEKIERRMDKWGLVEPEGSGKEERRIPPFPDRRERPTPISPPREEVIDEGKPEGLEAEPEVEEEEIEEETVEVEEDERE